MHLNTFTDRLVVLKVSHPAGRHCTGVVTGEEAESEGRCIHAGGTVFTLTGEELYGSLEW